MKPRTVGIFLDSFPARGGVFQYSQSLVEGLAALPPQEFRLCALFSHPCWEREVGDRPFQAFFRKNGLAGTLLNTIINRSPFPIAGWRRISHHVLPIPRLMASLGCDLWIFPAEDDWGYNANVPSAVAIHDLMHRYEPRFPEVRRQFRRRERRYRRICAWAEAVLVDSPLGKRHVIASYGVDEGRLHVLPYTVPQYLLAAGRPTDFEARYALPRKFIFYPSQFWQHKNHEALVLAMHALLDRLPDLHLVFVGSEKNSLARLQRLLEKLNAGGHVSVFGYVPASDMAEFYRRARAMVMPTFFGPTNIPPLEAMAAGCPLAVSDVYAMPAQVGDAALLFPPASMEGIADVLFRLWTDDPLCAELSRRGMARARELGQDHFNARLHEIVVDILRRRLPGRNARLSTLPGRDHTDDG